MVAAIYSFQMQDSRRLGSAAAVQNVISTQQGSQGEAALEEEETCNYTDENGANALPCAKIDTVS